jgi:fructose-1,6-bisphosphatase/inositol monophosphatase family enzyme
MIVCLVERGEPVGGWILHPRSGRLAVVERGSGVRLDGTVRRLEQGRALAEMRGYIGWKLLRTVRDDAARRGNLRQVGELGSRNCAGLEYLDLLAGERQFSLYRWTKPWDHAAGALMMREAGGVAERFDGRAYAPAQPGDAGIVTAPDRRTAQEIRELLLGETLPLLGKT